MNAADTSASSAMADCTPETVVSRSSTTAEIETFISDVSTTSTNIAIATAGAGAGGSGVRAGHGRGRRVAAIRASCGGRAPGLIPPG